MFMEVLPTDGNTHQRVLCTHTHTHTYTHTQTHAHTHIHTHTGQEQDGVTTVGGMVRAAQPS